MVLIEVGLPEGLDPAEALGGLFAEAEAQGRACLLLDYSGCGASDGDFAEGMLSKWRDEVLALIEARVQGPVVLAGSSMGGWLMLLVALQIPERVAALVERFREAVS